MGKLLARPALTPVFARAFYQFLDERGGRAFVRADVARHFYPMTRPRSRESAASLADVAIQLAVENGSVVHRGYRSWARAGSGLRLRSGREVQELDKTVELVLRTSVPQKWVLVDMETGELWTASLGLNWMRMPASAHAEVIAVLVRDEAESRD